LPDSHPVPLASNRTVGFQTLPVCGSLMRIPLRRVYRDD
jgi:hypothetical protein